MPWVIVLEFMYYRDLGNVLRSCYNSKVWLHSHEQLTLMVQVTEALKYLADKRFIHRDIAARNVLLSHNNEVGSRPEKSRGWRRG